VVLQYQRSAQRRDNSSFKATAKAASAYFVRANDFTPEWKKIAEEEVYSSKQMFNIGDRAYHSKY
jgi:hypothetical protein